MKVNSILIVGGGTSGWLTASALAYKFPHLDITLVESQELGTIGVGESTLAHINRFFDLLDLKDEDWMPQCFATYKASIQFTDFREKGTVFQYPFGGMTTPTGHSPQQYFECQAFLDNPFSIEDFARIYTLNGYMSENNKITNEHLPELGFNPDLDLAYHFDATLFAKMLKDKFCDNVAHIVDEVVDVEHIDGTVQRVILKQDVELEADLYIDCSGFASILLEGVTGSEFVPFKTLPNSRAVAAQIPYKDEADKRAKMICTTDCKAMSSGWIWRTPLWSRMGTGYVYSSDFQTSESAEEEFRQEHGWDGPVRHIEFRHGYHKKAWKNNVVGIGLSYGFIEPLESTGLLTTHENILSLVEILKRRNFNVNGFDRQQFNQTAYHMTKGLSDFVALHYGMSMREDTPYWRYVTSIEYDTYDDDVKRDVNLARDVAQWYMIDRFLPADQDGIGYVATGMGYSPLDSDHIHYMNKRYNIPKETLEQAYQDLNKVKQLRKTKVDSMLSHYDFLAKYIHKDR